MVGLGIRALSRGHGGAPAAGSVKRPAPGFGATGETRRLQPFGRAVVPPGPIAALQKRTGIQTETCKTHVALPHVTHEGVL
jgi:hypothetical protein